jgi:hypothetical protein
VCTPETGGARSSTQRLLLLSLHTFYAHVVARAILALCVPRVVRKLLLFCSSCGPTALSGNPAAQ